MAKWEQACRDGQAEAQHNIAEQARHRAEEEQTRREQARHRAQKEQRMDEIMNIGNVPKFTREQSKKFTKEESEKLHLQIEVHVLRLLKNGLSCGECPAVKYCKEYCRIYRTESYASDFSCEKQLNDYFVDKVWGHSEADYLGNNYSINIDRELYEKLLKSADDIWKYTSNAAIPCSICHALHFCRKHNLKDGFRNNKGEEKECKKIIAYYFFNRHWK